MVRITEIQIKNFRAFRGNHTIKLGRDGKNLLIYGENGSGKSSLFLALQLFLNSHNDNLEFTVHKNLFSNSSDDAFIKIKTSNDNGTGETTHTWSETERDTASNIIREASKTKGFLDYKSLLEVYFLNKEEPRINIFNLLINNLLLNTINRISGKTIHEEWSELSESIPASRRHTRKLERLNEKLNNFNNYLRTLLLQLQDKVTEILNYFKYPININLEFLGLTYDDINKKINKQEITLKINFLGQSIESPHHFLNEAKLSAIALSIYLASLLVAPQSDLKILFLDDVLIGLDMSNRIPIIEILDRYFQDWQVFFMTYDQEWFSIMKQRIPNSKWLFLELFNSRKIEDEVNIGIEIPVFAQDKKYLDKARNYFEAHDYKASVIYLRSHLEVLIKKFCEKKNLSVRYKSNPKNMTTSEFWSPIKNYQPSSSSEVFYLEEDLKIRVDTYLSIVLNPLSHERLTQVHRQEIQDAIETIEALEQALFPRRSP